jgi:hypothetical protein
LQFPWGFGFGAATSPDRVVGGMGIASLAGFEAVAACDPGAGGLVPV